MAAKKNTSKTAPVSGKAKPAVKPANSEAKSSAEAAADPVAADAAPKKTGAEGSKKAAAAKPKAAAKEPKAAAKEPKAAAKEPKVAAKEPKPQKPTAIAQAKSESQAKVSDSAKKTLPPKTVPPKTVPTKTVPTKTVPPKTVPPKSRSSVVDFPAPPAPIKPPFVPPKPSPATSGPGTSGGNGTHSPAFIQKQRQRLLDLRDDLVDAVSGMARDTIRNAPEGSEASGSGQHQGDAGSDAYDRDFALSVLAKEQDALYEIEQALRRIAAGTYGFCEMSSRKIPQARLEAIPFARLTVECQAQWEKEYGNRRFRPSDEVGFSGGKYADDEDSESVSLDEDDD